jgi:phosphoglycolate phosphatase
LAKQGIQKVKAVIFDSDGTLMDSYSGIVAAYRYIAKNLGEPQPKEQTIRDYLAAAAPLPAIMQGLFPGYPLEQLLEINSAFLADNFMTFSAFEGIRELLHNLHDQGLKLAIVTGGNAKIIDIMKHHGFDTYFTSIVHCDRVTRSKPDPEGFLLAVEECGVLPSEAIMVGDSPNDIFAGKNGGAGLTIGITHGTAGREQLQVADPDFIVDSVSELEKLLTSEIKR